MSNTNIHILTKNEYKMTRCQDGIILLFPIEGQLKLQHFTKTVNVENDIYVINNTDIFSILKNKKPSCFISLVIGLEIAILISSIINTQLI
ncbi:hypothetical protein [Staphylococcus haemolyticus]|uniref:hypothetical protein n=1 Tax=Staphylococcus haemolyticus TaxID=1283 RepID=UPI002DBEB1CF|nr:hypothetical protein [Staphylococcus haemolyticus]MEB5760351.1 hypothetical protein [Staphylococcus haemolyticus]